MFGFGFGSSFWDWDRDRDLDWDLGLGLEDAISMGGACAIGAVDALVGGLEAERGKEGSRKKGREGGGKVCWRRITVLY